MPTMVSANTNAATLIAADFRDTEDLDGLFSGFNPETGEYDATSWAYEEPSTHSDDGGRDSEDGKVESPGHPDDGPRVKDRAVGHEHGSGGPPLEHGATLRDDTLEHPRSVFQIVKRHYSRYTPEMVRDMCGISVRDFEYLARAVTDNSGRERTTCFGYATGWTQHTFGAQFIRAARSMVANADKMVATMRAAALKSNVATAAEVIADIAEKTARRD